jgi:uncharacterized cupin superfamily protein
MSITIVKGAAALPSSALESLGPVRVPLGAPVAELRGTALRAAPECGVWECTPGRWRRQVESAEFCHFLSGRCTFTPDGGPPLEIAAGDSVYFPARSVGVWHVLETVRKTYVLLE